MALVFSHNVFDWETCKLESCVPHEHSGPVMQMKMSSPRPPPTPDPYQTAAAQTQMNRDAAIWNAGLNRMDTYTPMGSQTFTNTGVDASGVPQYRQDINLTPEAQQLYSQQLAQNLQMGDIAGGMMDQVQGAYGRPIDLSGVPAAPGQGGLDAFRKQSQDAIYDRSAAYLDPQFERSEAAERTRLANQGIVEGSEAYRGAMDDFNRGKEMAYRQARNDAIIGGGEEMERAYGVGSAMRGSALDELFALRAQPLNEFNALRSASPVDMPSFSDPVPIMANAGDVQGGVWNAHNANMNAYNSRMAGRNSLMSGLFGLGSAAIMASDERVKEDIEPIGELNDGTNLYSFRYKGQPETQVGVMAQEVEKKNPKAVHNIKGVKHVNYSMVLADALEAA